MTGPRRWRDVPMPKAVARLHQDKRGFPVPWISEWDEGGAGWSIAFNDMLGAHAGSCVHRDGVGEPNLGALCAPRQIRGMLNRLCDVCGKKVGGDAYFMGGNDQAAAGINSGYRELPLHLDCVVYAGQVCPAMVTRAERIVVTKARRYTLDMVRMVDEDGGTKRFSGLTDPAWQLMEALGVRSICTALLAMPIDPVELPLAEFLAQHVGVSA